MVLDMPEFKTDEVRVNQKLGEVAVRMGRPDLLLILSSTPILTASARCGENLDEIQSADGMDMRPMGLQSFCTRPRGAGMNQQFGGRSTG